MTKHRPPLSIDAALARIAGQVDGGWSAMGRVAERSEGTVRAWGDPDRPEDVPLRCAIALDLAFQQAGGVGSPLHEVYTRELTLAGVAFFADRIALGRHAATLIREGGEAHAAIVEASQPGGDLAALREAKRELAQSYEAHQHALLLLDSLLSAAPRHAPGEPAGEPHQTGPP